MEEIGGSRMPRYCNSFGLLLSLYSKSPEDNPETGDLQEIDRLIDVLLELSQLLKSVL